MESFHSFYQKFDELMDIKTANDALSVKSICSYLLLDKGVSSQVYNLAKLIEIYDVQVFHAVTIYGVNNVQMFCVPRDT